MDVSPASRARSVWADLDALVLEEVDALRAGPDRPTDVPAFASEDEFVARVSAYLRGHHDPAGLVERLCTDLGLFQPAEEAPPGAGDELAPAVSDQEKSAPSVEGDAEPQT